ncbi:MAG TPA: SDR family NAD(P)-dependent oxidoreductase [Gaiellales bacterium]|jgi:NAD(P)-dependent dehydrogenase (short-subunit alcohol dehydrogenase family)|nr:SDR family NAD(P)-dependent oxidoreductase [Gaiellales bacterium]
MPHLLVFGARGLGRVVAEHLISQGWEATGVGKSAETAGAFPGRGVAADLTVAEEMRRVVSEAGAFDLAVNAMSPKGRFGGGDLTTTDDAAMAPYLEQLLPEVFAFFRICGGALAERGAGTIVQVTGGSARRALPGRAPWAAGAAGTRALSQAAANELKPRGVHAALLVCDGSFAAPGDDDGGDKIDPRELAKAIQFLHDQGRSAWTHELVVTPIGDRWTP